VCNVESLPEAQTEWAYELSFVFTPETFGTRKTRSTRVKVR
jgi:hypothetical protein